MKDLALIKNKITPDVLQEGENLVWNENRNCFDYGNDEQAVMHIDILRFSDIIDGFMGLYEVCELSDMTPISLNFYQNIMVEFVDFMKKIELFPIFLEKEYYIINKAKEEELNFYELRIFAFILKLLIDRFDHLIYKYNEKEQSKSHWQIMEKYQNQIINNNELGIKLDLF